MNKTVLSEFESLQLVLIAVFLCVFATLVNAQKMDDKTLVTMNDCWKYPTENIVAAGPASDRSNLYIAEEGGRITALTLSTGMRLWSTDIGGEVISNLLVADSNVYAVVVPGAQGSPNGSRLRSLSSRTGIPNLDLPFVPGSKVRLELANGKIVGISTGGSVVAFDRASESLSWNRSYPNIVPGTARVWGDKIVIATSEHRIILVSALTGEEIASVDTDRLVSAIGFIDHDLVWGDERGNVVRYDLEKRSIYWKFRNGAKISSLTTANEAVLAASYDNFVYLIHPYFGSVKWKKRLAGRASDVVIDDHLFAVVLAVGEPTAILLNLENGKPVGQVNVGMDESFLTQPIDADGKYIFFTNRQVFVQSTAPCSTK